MSLHKLADETAREIIQTLGHDTDRLDEVSSVVEGALKKAIQGTKEGCVETVNLCCSADQDLAHKISEELGKKEQALIANLSSLR
jgi:hypothetical protein